MCRLGCLHDYGRRWEGVRWSGVRGFSDDHLTARGTKAAFYIREDGVGEEREAEIRVWQGK